MQLSANLAPGAMVIAADNFGPIIRGQSGMIASCKPGSWLPWRRTKYVCTFLGGINAIATAGQIMVFDHGCSRAMLEDPLWFLHIRNAFADSSKFAAEFRRSAH